MRLNMGFMSRVFAQGQTAFQPPADPDAGEWVGGRWVPAEPPEPITVTATILPMTALDLQFYDGGSYSTEDRKVIVSGDVALPLETTFERDGATFEIREARDYDAVAGLRRYVAKRLHNG